MRIHLSLSAEALLTQGLLAAFFNLQVVRLFNLAIRQNFLQRLYDEHLCFDVLMIECYFSLAIICLFEEFHLFRALKDKRSVRKKTEFRRAAADEAGWGS